MIENEPLINEIPDSFLSSARKAKFIGEAKFLRALFYFWIQQRYGDAPLTVAIPVDGTGLTKSPQADIYAQIIADLQAAIPFYWKR